MNSGSKTLTVSLVISFLLAGNAAAQEIAIWGTKSSLRHALPTNPTNVVALQAGGFHTLALRAEGTVLAWGKNVDGQAHVPNSLSNIIAVSAGGDHSLALRKDGTVLGWGRNWDGQTQPPFNTTNVVAISAGWAHSLALRGDGSIVAWGNNVYGQTEVPATATQVKAIAAGHYHNVALRMDGAVVSWGSDYGVPSNATNVIAVAAGWEHSLALRADGSLVAWGDNSYGQLEVPTDVRNVVAIAAGYYHSVALLADGTLKSWGSGNLGVTNVPGGNARYCATSAGDDFQVALAHTGPPKFGVQRTSIVANNGSQAVLQGNACAVGGASYQWFRNGIAVDGALQPVLAIPVVRLSDAGSYTLVVSNSFGAATSEPITLMVQGEPSATRLAGGWGNNAYRQCDAFQSLKSPVAIAAGNFHAVGLNSDGTVAAWGKNRYGQTNVPMDATNIIAIAAGGNHSLALRNDGFVVGWGRDWDGQTLPPPDASNIVAIAAGSDHSLGLRSDGTVLAWGNNEYGQTTLPSGLRNITAIAAGYYHSLALRSDGTLIAWGLLDEVPRSATNIVAVSGGWWHSLALRADGTVVAWGDNRYGQIEIPEEATNVVAVSAGYGHSLALRGDGQVIAWGRPHWGLSDAPENLRDVEAISAGEDFNLVLVQTGGPTAQPPGPVVFATTGAPAIAVMEVGGSAPYRMQWHHAGAPIPGATNRWVVLPAVQATNSGEYVLYVTNAAGIVGSGTISLVVSGFPAVSLSSSRVLLQPGDSLSLTARVSGEAPVALQWLRNGVELANNARIQGADSGMLTISAVGRDDSGVFSLVASNAHGLMTSETAWVAVVPILAWGDNSSGQLEVPPAAMDAVHLAAGSDHSLALLSNGSVVGWGADASGQSTPPTALSDAVAISAGDSHGVALTARGNVVAWGENRYGQLNVPAGASNIVALSAGAFHTLALRMDGTVLSWGSGPGTNVPRAATNVVAVAAGKNHSVALAADGNVITWGTWYRLPVGLTNVVAIGAGDSHAVALRADGSVITWGKSSLVDHDVPPAATNIVAISAGGEHTIGLRADGAIIGWGQDYAGQAKLVPSGSRVQSIAAGGAHNLALVGNGTLTVPAVARDYEVVSQQPLLLADSSGFATSAYQWFLNGTEIPGATNRFLSIPRAQSANGGVYHLVSTGAHGQTRQAFHVTVTRADASIQTEYRELLMGWGELVCLEAAITGEEPVQCQWSLNGTNLLDDGNIRGAQTRTLCIDRTEGWHSGVYTLSVSNAYGAISKELALLTITPALGWVAFGNVDTNVPISATNLVAVAAANLHNLALRADGSVTAWGWGNDLTNYISGAASISNAVALFTSGNGSYTLDTEGNVMGLGQASVPPQATNIVLLDSGPAGTIALRADGEIVVWGVQGTTCTNLPPPAKRVVDVASGTNFVAVCEDGSVVTWGAPGIFSPPADATNVVKIAAGRDHFLALRRDGTVLAWSSHSSFATRVPSTASNVVAIAAEPDGSLALTADGEVLRWGRTWWPYEIPSDLPKLVSADLGYAHLLGLRESTPLQEFTERKAKILTPGSSQFLLAPRPGPEICTYQWQLDGQDLPGATNSFLLLNNFQAADQGTYRAVVRTPFRTVIGPATHLGAEGAPLMLRVLFAMGTQSESTLCLRLLGACGAGPIILESSADMATWTPVLTNQPAVGPLDLNVSLTNGPGRFFRVLELR